MKRKFSKKTATVFILVFLITSVHLTRFVIGRVQYYQEQKIDKTKTLGNPKSSFHIVEFTDFLCPACAKGSVIIKEYMKKYPSQIYLEYKYFPLGQIHPHAFKGALYAECAAQQGKFWAYHDILFARRKIWGKSINPDQKLREYAKEVDLNIKKLEACLEDENLREVVSQEKRQGKRMGVSATPTYFVNGKMVVGVRNIKAELKKFFKEEDSKSERSHNNEKGRHQH